MPRNPSASFDERGLEPPRDVTTLSFLEFADICETSQGNILAVYDLGTHDAAPYIVSE